MGILGECPSMVRDAFVYIPFIYIDKAEATIQTWIRSVAICAQHAGGLLHFQQK